MYIVMNRLGNVEIDKRAAESADEGPSVALCASSRKNSSLPTESSSASSDAAQVSVAASLGRVIPMLPFAFVFAFAFAPPFCGGSANVVAYEDPGRAELPRDPAGGPVGDRVDRYVVVDAAAATVVDVVVVAPVVVVVVAPVVVVVVSSSTTVMIEVYGVTALNDKEQKNINMKNE